MSQRWNGTLSVGIDEAGRGCVLGPLVVAAVAANEPSRGWFQRHNVRDSKLVPPRQREELAAYIRNNCWYSIAIATPIEIDRAVADRSCTLNGLELRLMSTCLKNSYEHHPDRDAFVLVDAPSINAHGFLEQLYMASNWHDMESIRARHHADRDNRTVGAASIIAKSERERLITELKHELGCDFGSGYCHDPTTLAHLKTLSPNAAHVRWSWTTAQRVLGVK